MSLTDPTPEVEGRAPDGTAIGTAGNPVLLGGSDGLNLRTLLVSPTGQLNVIVSPPVPPAGATEFVFAVSESQLRVGSGGDVASPHDADSAVIANGTTLKVQLVEVGTEGDPTESGSKIEVYWVTAGPVLHLLTRLFVNAESTVFTFPSISKARDGTLMVGNGTNFLRVRRSRFSAAQKQIDFAVRGYTE